MLGRNVRSGRLNRENGAWCGPDDVLGHTPHDESTQAFPPMCSHHDQVRMVLLGDFEDFLNRIAINQCSSDWNREIFCSNSIESHLIMRFAFVQHGCHDAFFRQHKHGGDHVNDVQFCLVVAGQCRSNFEGRLRVFGKVSRMENAADREHVSPKG